MCPRFHAKTTSLCSHATFWLVLIYKFRYIWIILKFSFCFFFIILGHINDTIVVNQPRIATEVDKIEEEQFIEEHITEDSEMAEEHLIIDGPVQFGNESESQAADDPIGDNSMPAEILDGDDLSDVIVTDQIFVTEDGQYIKAEDGLVQIKTKDGDGKLERFAWVNFVNDRES